MNEASESTVDNKASINSATYWDERFKKDWAEKRGGAYTRAYAELVVENFPGWLRHAIRTEGMSICDWGCAEGESAAYLAQVFPGQRICGVDVAQTAIEHASEKFPSVEFRAEDWLKADAEAPVFDLVLTSHVLEHFPDPTRILREVLAPAAKKLLVMLVPFAEDPSKKDEEHLFRFLHENVFVNWRDWRCVAFRIMDTATRAGACWRGWQLMVVYAREEWFRERGIEGTLHDWAGDSDTLKHLIDVLRLEKDGISKKLELQYMHDQNLLRLNGRLHQDNEALHQDNEALHQDNEALHQDNEALHQEREALQQEKEALQQEKEALQQEKEALQQEKEALQQEKEALQQDVSSLEAQRSRLVMRNEQLVADLERQMQFIEERNRILYSPPRIALFYARALARRLRRPVPADEAPAASAPAAPSPPVPDPAPTSAPPDPSPPAPDPAPTSAPPDPSPPAPDPAPTSAPPDPSPPAPDPAPSSTPAPPPAPASPPPPAKPQFQVAPSARKAARKQASRKGVRVGAILDAFSHACFEPECQLITFTPEDWRETLEREAIDFLLVESAWRGKQDTWEYRIASFNAPAGHELDDVLAWCNRAGIPAVFWNKEDPPNFDRFIETAAKFDYVFTTDAHCIDDYRKRCGHDRITALPFAAQPAIHNPVTAEERAHRVCFAGTYYADCFAERRHAMENLLRGSVPWGLDIYDRMHGHTGADRARFLFPDEFQPYVRGKLDYAAMLEAYRRYRVFLNVNSVSDSPTMFARRVFELMACGTPVVSTPSIGIDAFFAGLVPCAQSVEETRAALTPLMEDDLHWSRVSAQGVRAVMRSHTYKHRLAAICSAAGMRTEETDAKDCTVLLLPSGVPEQAIGFLKKQTSPPNRVLVPTVSSNAEAYSAALREAGMDSETCAPDQTEAALTDSGAAAVVTMDARHAYGPNYLLDAVLAFEYCGAGKTGIGNHFRIDPVSRLPVLTQDEGEAGFMARRCLRATLSFTAAAAEEVIPTLLCGSDDPYYETECWLRPPFGFIYDGASVETEEHAEIAYC